VATLEFWANVVGVVFAFAAAIAWLEASLVRIPPFPDVGFNSYSSVFEPVRTALRATSRRNALAAALSCVAALAGALTSLCHLTAQHA
jgi:hypothetical protein